MSLLASSLHILVISLAGAEQRRDLMRAQLNSPGMPLHRFVEGIDGSRLDASELAKLYDKTDAQESVEHSLTAPEIGCAASHLSAYRHIVANDIDLAVVLEDDALLGLQFVNGLHRLSPMVYPDRAQAVLLCHVVRYSAWGAKKVDKVHRLCQPYEVYGAHAYLITRAGAAAMLAAFPRVRTVADDWGHFARAGILEVSALVPYLVGTAPISVSSQIGDERYTRVSGTPFRRWVRKYLWQKFLFQIFVKPALRLHRVEQTW